MPCTTQPHCHIVTITFQLIIIFFFRSETSTMSSHAASDLGECMYMYMYTKCRCICTQSIYITCNPPFA